MSFPRYPAYKDSGVEWLGSVPAHWDVAPFKRMVSLQNGSDHKHIECDDGYPVIGSGGPFAYASEFMHDGESVLLGRKGTIDKPLYVTGKFWTVDTMYWSKIQPGVFGRFAYYSALTIPFGYYSTNTALPSMTKSVLEAHLLATPPEQEQVAIAAFLDRETGKIDALVAEQEQLITLLKEKRQAVISHAVTKGLDPSVPMKDSGVEWLGEVPEHWDVNAIKHIVATPITDGPHETPAFPDEGIPFVSAEAVSTGVIDFQRIRGFISEEDHARYSLKYKPQRGDIFMVKSGATTGVTAMVETDLDFNIWSPLAVIRPALFMSPRYVLQFMRSSNFQEAVTLNWSFGTQQNIGMGVIENLMIAVPPLAEQVAIADHLGLMLDQFQPLITEATQAIQLLQERRSALISAAVTGQIDVRGLATQEAG